MRTERRKFHPLYFSKMHCNLDVCGVLPWDFYRATFLMYCMKKNDVPNTVILLVLSEFHHQTENFFCLKYIINKSKLSLLLCAFSDMIG